MDENSEKYLLLKRNLLNGDKECIIYFQDNIKGLINIKRKIKEEGYKKIFIFLKGVYHTGGTYIINNLLKEENYGKVEKTYFPYAEMSRKPSFVSFDSREEWDDNITIAVIPQKYDWEFFELEWILQRWESAFSFFDYDSFWPTPSYPLDLWNNPIEPKIILFYCEQYIKKYSYDKFKIEFFGLYNFYKDNLGKDLLKFIYKELTEPSKDKTELYQRFHFLYHNTEKNHPFLIFLYYRNYSVVKNKFKLHLFINQFLSFQGMFLCVNFCERRLLSIWNGLKKKYIFISNFFHDEKSFFKEIRYISEKYGKNVAWIGRESIKDIDRPFWKFLYINWWNISRNLFLWDNYSVKFGDDQIMIGSSIRNIFPSEWTRRFYEKNYNPTRRIVPSFKKKGV